MTGGLCLAGVLAVTLVAQVPRPQDDLFLHVNQEWIRSTPIPDDHVTYSAAHELVDRIEGQIQGIVDELRAAEKLSTDGRRILDLYDSVVDDEAVERLGLAPVQSDLSRLNGITNHRRAAETAGYLSSVAAGGIFDVHLTAEGRRALVATVRPGGLLLPDAGYYLTPTRQMLDVRRHYAAYLASLFEASGRTAEEAATDAGLVIRLETRLAALMQSTRASAPLRLTWRELMSANPGFDWEAWARPQGLQRARAVVLMRADFFHQFGDLMTRTSPDTLRAWLLGRYLTAMAPYLPRAFARARFEFFGTRLTGQETARPLWKRGVSMISELMGDAVGREYAARYFPESTRIAIESMVTNIRAVAREAIAQAEWIEPEHAKALVTQLETVKVRVGVPDAWRSYAGLTIRADERLGNLRRLRAFESLYRLKHLRGEANSREWMVGAHSVNAFYNPALRTITVPAGILQAPYFTPGGDDAGNYGAIGAVIGHEISHALYVNGMNARAGALRARYAAKEVVPGVRVNGTVTFGENVADLIGLDFAYRAYRRSLEGRDAVVLGGLTGDQRFFLGWARIWRGQSRPDFLRYNNETSPHAPFPVRANGVVVHLDAFHRAFGVKSGDGMFLPEDQRVRIW